MTKIIRQVCGRARTRPRHLPPSSGLFPCNTLSNLITPHPLQHLCSNHHCPTPTYLLTPKPGSHLSCLCSLCSKAIPSPPFNFQGPAPPGSPSWLSNQTHPQPTPFPKSPIFIRTQQPGLSSLTAVIVLYYLEPGRMSTPQSWLVSLHLLSHPQLHTQLLG